MARDSVEGEERERGGEGKKRMRMGRRGSARGRKERRRRGEAFGSVKEEEK